MQYRVFYHHVIPLMNLSDLIWRRIDFSIRT